MPSFEVVGGVLTMPSFEVGAPKIPSFEVGGGVTMMPSFVVGGASKKQPYEERGALNKPAT